MGEYTVEIQNSLLDPMVSILATSYTTTVLDPWLS